MTPTGNELVDEVLIPKIEKLFMGLYGGDPRPDLHEDLIKLVNSDTYTFSLNFDLINHLRCLCLNNGHLSLADHWADLSFNIRETAKYFMADYPHIYIENVY